MRLDGDAQFLLGLAMGLGAGWLLARGARLRADAAEVNSPAGRCGPVHRALCERLHGSAFGPFHGLARRLLPAQDHSYAHTNLPAEFLCALFARLRPAFLVEVGSFKGGSALRIAGAAAAALPAPAPKPCLLCVDTFLGDAAMWLDHNAGWRNWLMLEHGVPRVYWQFLANVEAMSDVILPLPLASMCALRALQRLAAREDIPLADFVYLDSAHEKGETLLEIRQAFRLLRAGGVLLGDDLDWPAVESDLHTFLDEVGPDAVAGCGDELLSGVPGLLFLSAPAPGYWVVDSSPRQWLLRKAPAQSSQAELGALRAALGAEQDGEAPADYVPLTDADREALALYDEAVALSESGRLREAMAAFKQAAGRSASLAFHYKL